LKVLNKTITTFSLHFVQTKFYVSKRIVKFFTLIVYQWLCISFSHRRFKTCVSYV